MTNIINIDECRSYASEANLDKALNKMGLDNWQESHQGRPCRYIKVRNSEGRWTAIFMASEHCNAYGGYVAFASQHGFMSV